MKVLNIVQTVLVKLWKSLASFSPEKARFRTWLSVVVHNSSLGSWYVGSIKWLLC
ncbi:MAG: hypothetical protein CBE26_00445 [Kiritimatiellaceae bacterium TMED266]|nr:MAG: hypothetical protein CBE26_00445 [Kiritimatiellaceae bacterium TMED266]